MSVSADATGSRRILPIAEALRRHGRPDVIHIHWTEPYIAGGSSRVSRIKAKRTLLELRMARRAGIALVWTAHDLFRHDRREDPNELAFMRALFELIDAEDFTQAREKIAALEQQLGEHEPELTRAQSLITFLEGSE